MRLLALLGMLAGCESMEPSGELLKPVAIEPTTAPVAEPAAAAPTAEVPAAEEQVPAEEFKISSEQMQQNAEQDGADSVAVAVAAVSGTAEPAPAAPAPAVPEPTPAPVAGGIPAALLGFPLRLVKTIPEAQPPRAILALQDGREVVVTPGQLLPDPGVIVLAIGRDNLQLARVEPAGDKANISALTLTAQY